MNHVFTNGSRFEDVIERYEFDNALRKILFTAMLYLCDAVHPSNKLREDISQLMKEYAHLPIQRMGFFDGWEQESIWATK